MNIGNQNGGQGEFENGAIVALFRNDVFLKNLLSEKS